MYAVTKRFDEPEDVRHFALGKFELLRVGTMTIGRATYEPGWKWSEHVGAAGRAIRCQIDHVGFVVSGHAKVMMDDGTELDLRAGDFFAIGPGHDSWVVGNEPYVSLHFMGAEDYAT